MVAFAANSLLNRAALAEGEMSPATFSLIRVASGAAVLLIAARFSCGGGPRLTRRHGATSLALALYLVGFSFAYLSLDAGIGALILFAGVQFTMFAGALASGVRPGAARWAGMGIGLAGLAWLLWPGEGARVTTAGAVLMLMAAFGWGVYSLLGRGARDPLSDTAASFLLASPLLLVIWLLSGEGLSVSASGLVLALTSGIVTSGLGYTLWYHVLPALEAVQAGLAQLTVPVIAVMGGALLLSEALEITTLIAAGVVLVGVALGVLGPSGRSSLAGRR